MAKSVAVGESVICSECEKTGTLVKDLKFAPVMPVVRTLILPEPARDRVCPFVITRDRDDNFIKLRNEMQKYPDYQLFLKARARQRAREEREAAAAEAAAAPEPMSRAASPPCSLPGEPSEGAKAALAAGRSVSVCIVSPAAVGV